MTNPYQNAPASKKMITLIGIYIALVFNVMEATSASTLLSAASMEIGGTAYFSLTTTIKGAAAIVFMAIYGAMAARMPGKKPHLIAISMLIAAASLFVRAISTSMIIVVITGSTLSVISGACSVVGYSLIRDMYEPKQAGLYLGFTVTFMSIGRLVGPTLLGMITDFAGWRVAYHALWPLAFITAVLVMIGARITDEEAKSIEKKIGKFDALGSLGITVFSIPLVLFITLGTSYARFGGILSNIFLALTIVGLIILVVDIRKKGDGAIIPAGVLKDRNTLLVTASLSLGGFANMAASYFIPTYILYVMLGSATQAGMSSSIASICGLVLGPFLGRQVAKSMNARGLLALGSITRIVITAILIILISPTMQIAVLMILLFFTGVYSAIQSVAQSAVPQLVIKPELRVQSNSFMQVVITCIQNCGTSTFGAILAGYGIANGFKPAFYVSIAAAVLSLVCALFIKKPQKQEAQA